MTSHLAQLAAVFATASIIALVSQRWRLPILIAYLLTGLIIGQTGWLSESLLPVWRLFSDIGIALLLFLVGLEINYSALKRVGSAALVIGLGQVIITFVAGFVLTTLLGMSALTAAYVAAALTFSSTVIVVKLLSEKNDLSSLYGKITLGILLVQDIVAILILVVLGSHAEQGNAAIGAAWAILKGAGLFLLTFWLGRQVMPKVFNLLAHSREMLFVGSLAWLFVMAALAEKLGLTMAGGGFLAGLALAHSIEHWQIASRIRPVRDFFIAIFFIFLGSSLAGADFSQIVWPILVLALFVLIGNPLIVMLIMHGMGYHHRTGFMTGLNIAQISEFSFVLVALGLQLGHIDVAAVTLVTGIGIISLLISSAVIVHNRTVYHRLHPWIHRLLGQTRADAETSQPVPSRRIVLIGAHRTGWNILQHLTRSEVLVIEFDPDTVNRLRQEKYEVLFGDAGDSEILDRVHWTEVGLVVATNPDPEDHLQLIDYLRRLKSWSGKVIVRAETNDDASRLYAHGASYVLLPPVTAGQFLGQAISRDPELKDLARLRRLNNK